VDPRRPFHTGSHTGSFYEAVGVKPSIFFSSKFRLVFFCGRTAYLGGPKMFFAPALVLACRSSVAAQNLRRVLDLVVAFQTGGFSCGTPAR
jgi:hypothetical protein